MSRSNRATTSQDTVEIVERGSYLLANGVCVDIAQWVAECLRGTTTIAPTASEVVLATIRSNEHDTKIEVTNETTLAAARRIVVDDGNQNALCLNFASAKNPGGGFLGGSQAQEESLARSSGLYASLITQNDSYYETNRKCRTALYTDTMILSPNVPVFRDDGGNLLATPYRLTMLTSPAANAGAVKKNEPEKVKLIRPTMDTRIANVLSVAAQHGYQHLILGAWGCGVFRNDPEEIAELFANALLSGGQFASRFVSVTFAIFDSTTDARIITPFASWFAGENKP